MRRLVKYFNPGVCQAWQEWVKRHEKSLIWSLQVLNLTCLERVYNWFLDIGNTATVKRDSLAHRPSRLKTRFLVSFFYHDNQPT